MRYKIWLAENSLVLIAIFLLQMILLKRKKRNSFEVKIILSMFLAYLEGFAFRLDMVFYQNEGFKSLPEYSRKTIEAAALTLIMFAHWTYASKYM